MIPLQHDPHFTFRFADSRIIPRIHLEGIEPGRSVKVYALLATGEPGTLLAEGTVGDGGWVELSRSIIVHAGDAFLAVPGELR